MEEKKYEGTVQITSAEYRELVTEAVEAKARYDAVRSENWKHESTISKLEKELAETRKELDSCRQQFSAYAASLSSTRTPLDHSTYYNLCNQEG